jgi:hypothetical protein
MWAGVEEGTQMTEATGAEESDEPPRPPDAPAQPPDDLPEVVHLLNSEESDFLGLGVRRRVKIATNILLDGLVVIFFAAISFLFDWCLARLHLEGVAAATRDAVSAIFAVGTIAYAVILMLADLYEFAKELFRR